MGINDGRVVIVTGSGRGIGREHALAFAATGAKVVVNDLGGDARGEGGDLSPAMQTVEDIKAMGGEASPTATTSPTSKARAGSCSRRIDTFGRLDVVVNNAGILRDRMLVNMAEAEWDAVIAVHLKGTFGPTRHAAEYWRNETKAGRPVDAPHRQHERRRRASSATPARRTTAPRRPASPRSPSSAGSSSAATASPRTRSRRSRAPA